MIHNLQKTDILMLITVAARSLFSQFLLHEIWSPICAKFHRAALPDHSTHYTLPYTTANYPDGEREREKNMMMRREREMMRENGRER